jgi:subtilase family serine protease
MAVRPSRAVSVIAGCAALAGIAAATPATAANDQSASGDRVAVTGSTPAWATPGAKLARVDAGTTRHVQVALALRDQAGAEALAKAISTPGSPQFRQTLSASQFTDRFAATQATVNQVTAWLRQQGLTVNAVAGNRHFVDATADAGTLERAFGTTLAMFKHTLKSGKTAALVAPERPITLPRSLRAAVTSVLGLDDSEKTITPQRIAHPTPSATAAAGAGCATSWGQTNNTAVPQVYGDGGQSNLICGYNTPQTRSIYGLTAANTGAGTTIGIVGAYNGATTLADANRAAGHFGSPALAADKYSVALPSGGFNNDPSCEPDAWAGEQALDVQASHTVAPAASIRYYAAKDCFSLYSALNAAVSENKVSVISNSWGYNGGESTVPPATRQQIDAIGIQAAIQGQSIIVSSGDAGDNSGVAGKPSPAFPASNPWVTAVGGTSVAVDSSNRKLFDTGWTSTALVQSGSTFVPTQDKDGPFAGGAGGGVSSIFDRPDYQAGKVPAGTKRMVPDLSALADAYTGFAVGQTVSGQGYVEYGSGGTSLAAPLVAGLAANAAQAGGTDRLGFLNPAIYDLAGSSAIADVTAHKRGVWTPVVFGYGGVTVPSAQGSYFIDFDAKPQTLQSGPGWDAVTGVGTPAAGFVTALGT